MQCIGVNTTGEHLARGRYDGVICTRQACNRVKQNNDVTLVLNQALGLLDHHLGNLYVTTGRFVKGRRHDFTTHGTFHLGNLFRALIDKQHHQVDVRRIGTNCRSNVLQQHRLTGFRRRDNQPALTFTNRRDHVDNPRGEVLGRAIALLQHQAFRREQRGQVLEQYLAARVFGRVVVDFTDLEQREVALAFFRRPDQARNRVTRAQAEATNLTGTDINVVRTCEVGAVG